MQFKKHKTVKYFSKPGFMKITITKAFISKKFREIFLYNYIKLEFWGCMRVKGRDSFSTSYLEEKHIWFDLRLISKKLFLLVVLQEKITRCFVSNNKSNFN